MTFYFIYIQKTFSFSKNEIEHCLHSSFAVFFVNVKLMIWCMSAVWEAEASARIALMRTLTWSFVLPSELIEHNYGLRLKTFMRIYPCPVCTGDHLENQNAHKLTYCQIKDSIIFSRFAQKVIITRARPTFSHMLFVIMQPKQLRSKPAPLTVFAAVFSCPGINI